MNAEAIGMVYTVTLNPALDYVLGLERFGTKDINRAESEQIFIGGKGINVSAVLCELDTDNIALGIAAGFTGKHLISLLDEQGINNDFVLQNEGATRINVKLRADREMDINAKGPCVTKQSVSDFLNKLDKMSDGDWLVLSGSLPKGVSEDIYSVICERVRTKNIRIVADTTGDKLLGILKYSPYLIKPNHHELGELFGTDINSKEEAIKYAERLQEMGAMNVLVSCGAEGSVFVGGNGERLQRLAVIGKLINSVGCGDSMVAGFIAGMEKYGSVDKAYNLSVAAASATAFSEGLAKASEIYKYV